MGWLTGGVVLFFAFIPVGLLAKPVLGAGGALLAALVATPVLAAIVGCGTSRLLRRYVEEEALLRRTAPRWTPAHPNFMSPDGLWWWSGVSWVRTQVPVAALEPPGEARGHRRRPRLLTVAFIGGTPAIGMTVGLIAALDPLHETASAEAIGGLLGVAVGVVVVMVGLALVHLVQRLRTPRTA